MQIAVIHLRDGLFRNEPLKFPPRNQFGLVVCWGNVPMTGMGFAHPLERLIFGVFRLSEFTSSANERETLGILFNVLLRWRERKIELEFSDAGSFSLKNVHKSTLSGRGLYTFFCGACGGG